VAAPSSVVDLFWYEEYETGRPFKSFLPTAAKVLFRPRRFFARLDPEGSFLTGLAFASVCVGVYAALSTVSSAMVEVVLRGATLTTPNVIGATLANVGASVLAVWLLTPIAAAVYHLTVRLLVGRTNRGYRATFRVITYSGATDLVGWLPFVGPLVACAWALYLGTLGLRELHMTTTRRALAAVLVPTGTVASLGVGWLLFGAAALELIRR
jgi:hypothetical protein